MSNGLYGEVYNIQSFLQQLVQGPVNLCMWQDNNAVLQVLKAGYSAKLRHCNRVHRVNVASLSESLQDPTVRAERCPTDMMKANGLTKIIQPNVWTSTLQQYGLQQDQL